MKFWKLAHLKQYMFCDKNVYSSFTSGVETGTSVANFKKGDAIDVLNIKNDNYKFYSILKRKGQQFFFP